MTEFYVYQHRRRDNGAIFYVGKGSRASRMNERLGRNIWWQRIVAKAGGFDAEVVGRFRTETEAFEVERALIAHYGKARLCNLTDGGEGHHGLSPSSATREKLRRAVGGERHPNWGKRLSVETCRRKSESMKASAKNLRGKKLPSWWRDRIRATKIGPLNPMFGKPSPLARRVRIREVEYPSIMAAARAVGYSFQGVANMLSGHRRNRLGVELA